MKIIYGNIDVSKYIISYRKKGNFIDGNILGQVPIYENEIEVSNKDKLFDDMSKEFFVYEDNDNQTGIFNIYEKPEKYTSIIKFVLYDNMIKLNKFYETSLDFSNGVLVRDVLEDIATKSGLTIIYDNLPGHILNKSITWYDNTLPMIDYVGWIAEIAGTNASANNLGEIVFNSIASTYEFELERVGDLEVEDSFIISNVCFDNGEVQFTSGTSENDTLFLNANNPFIDDQSIVDYLCEKYSGYSFTNISTIKFKGNRNIRLGNVIKYLDYQFIVTSLIADEFGGEAYPIYTAEGIACDLDTSEKYKSVEPSIKYKAIEADLGRFKELTTLNLTAMNASISGKLEASVFDAYKATIDEAYMTKAEIESAYITEANIKSYIANQGYVTNLQVNTLLADKVTTSQLDAATARITTLESTTVKANELQAKVGEFGYLKASEAELTYATITNLNSANANIASISGDLATYKKTVTEEFEARDATIDELIAKDAEIDSALIKKATVADLEAATARISTLETDTLKTNQLSAEVAKLGYATVTELNASNAKIDTLTAKDVEISNKLTVTEGNIKNLQTDKLNASEFTAYQATVTELLADKATVKELESTNAAIESLQANDANIEALVANKANITDLNSTNAEIDSLKAKDAEIDTLLAKKIDASTVESTFLKSSVFETEKASINELISEKATIDDLDSSNARISTLETTTLKSAELSAEVAKLGYATVTELNAAKGRIDTLEADTVKTDELESTVATFGYLKTSTASATYATITNLNSANANINSLTTKVSNIEKAYVNEATVNELIVAKGYLTEAEVETLVVDKGYLNTAQVNTLITNKGYITNAQAETLIADKGYITTAETTNLLAGYATIDLANVKAGSITTAMIGTGVVGTAQIADGSITDAKIVGLTASKITAGTLDAGTIDVINLNAANITVGTINGQQIANGAIDTNKLSSSVNSSITNANTNASQALTDAANAQDTANSALSAAGDAQTTADGKNTVFYQSSAPSKTGRKINDVWFDTDDGNKMYYWNGTAWTAKQFGTNAIANASIINALIADATIQSAKIANLDAAKITTGTLSADRIASGSISSAKIASNAITSDKIATNAIIAEHITTGVITGDKLVASTITGDKIASKTITASNIAANTITAAQIATGTITATQIASGTITATQIKSGAITSALLAADSVTAEKINVSSLSAISADLGTVTAGSINIGNGNFVVTSAGNLTAKNGEFEGKITTTSGKIGFLNINTYGLDANLSGGQYSDYAIRKDYFKMSVFHDNSDFTDYAAQLYMDTYNDGLGRIVFSSESDISLRIDESVYITKRTEYASSPYIHIDYTGESTTHFFNIYNAGMYIAGDTTFDGKVSVDKLTSYQDIESYNGSIYVYNGDIYVDGYSYKNHTHNYAGSSSVGGSATSAVKLDSSAGSATQPVYFANGVPVATAYTLGKSVPSDAKFTDTTYTSLKNPYALTIQGNGTTLTNGTYDGSTAKTINITPGAIGAAASSHTHSIYLAKTTYEYNAELAMGSSGKICIGKFKMYDSNITVRISSTTNTTYSGTLIIATQNYGKGGTATFSAAVYGDPTDTIASNIYIYNVGSTGVVEVYFSPSTYSKNLVHVQCMALSATPTDVLTSVSAIPSNATTKPTNVLKTALDGKSNTSHTHSNYSLTSHTHDYAASSHTHSYLPLSGGTLTGALTMKNTIHLNRVGGTSYGRLGFYSSSYYTWYEYMSNVAAGACPTGGQPSSYGDVTTWARRSIIEGSSGYGWIWEAATNAAAASTTTAPTPIMALSSNTGNLAVKGSITEAGTLLSNKYAAKSHTHDYASSSHTHSGYASSSHTHSNYAQLHVDNTYSGKNIFTASNTYNTTDTQRFIVGNSDSAFVFGGDGLQCFAGTSSTVGKNMYINYYGGSVLIGKSGGTQEIVTNGITRIVGSSGDTPMTIKSASTGTYVQFLNSGGTSLGYYGYSGANTPVVYLSSGAKAVLHADNYNSYAAPKQNGIYYIEGTGSTAGTWLGSHDEITAYYEGLVVAYKIPVAGASTTTLNINSLGAVKVVRNVTTAVSTAYAVQAVLVLIYTVDTSGTAYWKVADYDSNTYLRVYRQTTGYNADYPLLVSRTAAASIATAGTNGSNEGVYAVMWDDTSLVPTLNPSTGLIKAAGLTITKNDITIATGTTQSATKGIKWSAINSKNPYIGYATDQVDGTFVIGSLLGTNYASGLAIGGGSGNLLWKGAKVATATDLAGYATTGHTHSEYASSSHTHSGYASSSHTHSYLPLSGGTVTGSTTFPAIELSGATPYIDFHFGSSTADNTSRIIESSSGVLNINGTVFTKTDSGSRLTAAALYKTSTTYPVYGCRVLYSNSTGTTGNVTLAESAANFTYIIIIAGFSDTGASGSLVVYSPNGKTVDVGTMVATSNGGSFGRVRYSISGTTMSVVSGSNYIAKVSSGSWSYTANGVYCKAVLGFK